MNNYFKNAVLGLIGLTIIGAAVPLANRLAAQTTPTTPTLPAAYTTGPLTRIYLNFFTGSDAGYTSLIHIDNTGMDPWGTTPTPVASTTTMGAGNTCYVDAYAGGKHYPATYANPLTNALGPINPGDYQVFTEAQIALVTGITLANSGQRAYLMLTCNFKYAHARGLLVNPTGTVVFNPGLIIPPNRALGVGPEQLLQ